MKTLLIILLFAGNVFASPFLKCDEDANCEYYKVYADGQLVADNVPAPLWYDLKDMTPGVISFDVECCNYWGCEKTENPYVSRDGPGKPQNLRMEMSQ